MDDEDGLGAWVLGFRVQGVRGWAWVMRSQEDFGSLRLYNRDLLNIGAI